MCVHWYSTPETDVCILVCTVSYNIPGIDASYQVLMCECVMYVYWYVQILTLQFGMHCMLSGISVHVHVCVHVCVCVLLGNT